MPRKKTTRGQLKTVSCPRCGKKFPSETNVLQHMNQPNGRCYIADIITAGNSTEGVHNREDFDVPDIYRSDNDIDMTDIPPASPEYDEPHPFSDFDVPPAPANRDAPPTPANRDAPPTPSHYREGHPDYPGRFVEVYEGCTAAFPGGETFMGRFRSDRYAEQRRENIYFPFVSRKEWEFASWLLRSSLSMAAIDSLLSLEIVSGIFVHVLRLTILQIRDMSLSFRSANELRTRAETLPSGPQWVCETLKTEYPTLLPACLFYCDPLECLQALLSHPLFKPHISFFPQRLWTCAAKVCCIYDEWLSGDHAWSMQVSLSFTPGSPMMTCISPRSHYCQVLCSLGLSYRQTRLISP